MNQPTPSADLDTQRTAVLVSAVELMALVGTDRCPVILDASLIVHTATFDGDNRSDSGLQRWRDGHIPGSRHVDVGRDFSDTSSALHYSHPAPASISAALARIGISPTSDIVIYDGTGMIWAARLWFLLRWIGINARVLDGGWAAWCAAGGDVSTGDTPAPVVVPAWTPRTSVHSWVSAEEIAARLEGAAAAGARTAPLVCALSTSAFAGSRPTRYSRRGAIPGSRNVPSGSLLQSDGTLAPSAALAAEFTAAAVMAAGEAPPGGEVLLYCGAGIAASLDALALVVLGVPAVRIYDGSLEEWSADPTRPLQLR
ncbi:MAG: hypothetical protein JWQ43_944 [Glaciihabitans sp.]|nr:hypothetical protein [Glaciihabitans sp.]